MEGSGDVDLIPVGYQSGQTGGGRPRGAGGGAPGKDSRRDYSFSTTASAGVQKSDIEDFI